MEEFDTSGLISEYLDDARGHLDTLDASLLEMEKEIGQRELDVELVSELLGGLHTLKGNSGMMGFDGLQKYVHDLEGVFKSLIEGEALLGPAYMQKVFEAAAVIRDTLEKIEKDPKNPPDMSEHIKVLAGRPGEDVPSESGPVPTGVSRADSFKYIGQKSSTLKVDFGRLDNLLNLAGELVIHRTKLNQVESRFREAYPDRKFASELTEAAELIHKATSDLQEAIMKVRMVPIRQVFQRFPRMVRDLSRERGKEINLVFSGESTELDKTVIDEIGEPLIHLIRNAVDHGVELPDERLGKRKSPVGEIRLSASQEGNHIMITVSDDGAGIDLARVREKAAQTLGSEALGEQGRENILELIFESGFSTAKSVTEVSGRGVGLDVVRKNISRLGGIVEVDSAQGKGTTFTIKLPLTLAIISALLVRSGGETYALPLASVVESLRLDPGEVHVVNGRDVMVLRGRLLPILDLSQTFGAARSEEVDAGRRYVVVVGRAEKRVGLLVDGLLGRQEVVIKALDDYMGESATIAGATILGDGRVVLILEVAGLMEQNALMAGSPDHILKEVG